MAEAELFQMRWSKPVLDETERAIAKILTGRHIGNADHHAKSAVMRMEEAFEDAMVENVDRSTGVFDELPDAGDKHVLAAALQVRAAVIVTENVRHFPSAILAPLRIKAQSADDFIADIVSLHHESAVPAVSRMRARMKRPAKSADVLLADMEAYGLSTTARMLRPYARHL